MAEKPSKKQLIEEAEAIIEKHFEKVPHLDPDFSKEEIQQDKKYQKQLKKQVQKYEDAIEWIRSKSKKRFEKGEK